MNRKDDPRVVLFDVGGVLLELNNPVETFNIHLSEAEFHRRWILSPAVRKFERGASNQVEFANAITAEFGLDYGADDFLARFNAWPGGIMRHAIEFVRQIDPHISCGILSNTNALHWMSFGIDEAFASRFERIFLSFETGLLKPDTEAFKQVINEFSCPAEHILYFDDNPLNVSTASDLGMDAVLCRQAADMEMALESRNVIGN